MGFPFLKPKAKTGDYYFGLFLKENKGVGCVLHKTDKKVELLAKEHFNYTNGWEHITEDVDNLLSRLENRVDCHLEKTIFFFFSHFIDEKENAIKRPYSTKIKELTNALSLKAIGYIECNDAVSTYLTQYDNFPLTTILIEIDQNNLGIFIYKSGHKKLHKIVSRTDSIIEDILSAFMEQKEGVLLPSRIVLYNSSNLTEESSKIISYRWSSDLFVQTPRVEIMKEEDVLQSLITIFESQVCKIEHDGQGNRPPSIKEGNIVMGFTIGEDIASANNGDHSIVQNSKDRRVSFADISKIAKYSKKINVSKFVNYFFSIKSNLNQSVFFPVLGTVILLLSLGCIEYFFHKAKLIVLIPSQILQKELILHGQVEKGAQDLVSISVSTLSAKLSESTQVTGKRDIGEKAKGEVMFYNYDDKERVISKGTLVKFDSHTFQTTAEGKVPRATLAEDASAKLPGKVKIPVIADSIGPENNLEKNTRFSVSDVSFSTLFAINDLSFSGGTKSSVTTVSKQDIEDLKQILIAKAEKKPQTTNLQQLGNNIDILTDLTDVKLTDLTSSKEIGEEGDSVTIKATALTQYYYFSKERVKNMIQSQLKDFIPAGYRLDTSNIDYQIKKDVKLKNDITLTLTVKAKSIKNINVTKIPDLVRGKQKNQILPLLKNDFGLSDYSVEIVPDVPFINNTLPFFEKNIKFISQDL